MGLLDDYEEFDEVVERPKDIEFSGDGLNEKKEGFERMLAKWEEIFKREHFLDDIFLVRDGDNQITGKLNNGCEFDFFFEKVVYSVDLSDDRTYEIDFDCFDLYYATKAQQVFNIQFHINNDKKSGLLKLEFKSLTNQLKTTIDLQLNNSDDGTLTTKKVFEKLGHADFYETMKTFVAKYNAIREEFEKEWIETACEELDTF